MISTTSSFRMPFSFPRARWLFNCGYCPAVSRDAIVIILLSLRESSFSLAQTFPKSTSSFNAANCGAILPRYSLPAVCFFIFLPPLYTLCFLFSILHFSILHFFYITFLLYYISSVLHFFCTSILFYRTPYFFSIILLLYIILLL